MRACVFEYVYYIIGNYYMYVQSFYYKIYVVWIVLILYTSLYILFFCKNLERKKKENGVKPLFKNE